jgi:hypothetical protein
VRNPAVEDSNIQRRQVHVTHPPVLLCMNLEHTASRMLYATPSLTTFNIRTTNKWGRFTAAPEAPFPRTITNLPGVLMWNLSTQVSRSIVHYDIAVGRNTTQCTTDIAAASPHRMVNRFCCNIYPGHPTKGPLRGPQVFIRIFFVSHSLCFTQNSLGSNTPMAFHPSRFSLIE